MLRFMSAVAAVLLLAGSPASAQQIAEPITIQDEIYFGVRSVPGFDVTGTYLYESRGDPKVVLNADGTGEFARHGRPAQPITWWLLANADGTPKTNKGELGQQHTLIFQDADGEFDMNVLTIRYDLRQVIILGERFKPY